MDKPGFEGIRSLNDARRACMNGELAKALLVPIEFGGEDVPQNVVYVSPAACEAQSAIIKDLIGFVREQGAIQLHAVPEYRGDCFVPSRIIYQAFPQATQFAPMVRVVSIW